MFNVLSQYFTFESITRKALHHVDLIVNIIPEVLFYLRLMVHLFSSVDARIVKVLFEFEFDWFKFFLFY